MTRKLTTLGLAFAAVLAMSAMAASAAQAAPEFTSLNTETGKHEKTFLHATSEEGGLQLFETPSGVAVECTHLEAEGMVATGTATEITAENISYFGERSNTSSPHCETLKTFTTIVHMEGCHYRFHITKTLAKEKTYEGTVDIVCPTGKSIDIEVTKSGATTENPSLKCTVQVPSQNGLEKVTYHNIETAGGRTDVTVEANAGGIKYTTTGGALNCLQANGEHTGATYIGNSIVSGVNEAGKALDVTVMGE